MLTIHAMEQQKSNIGLVVIDLQLFVLLACLVRFIHVPNESYTSFNTRS